MTQKKIPCKSSNGRVDFLFSFLPVTQKKCLSMPRARVLYLTSLPANDMSFTLLITIYTSLGGGFKYFLIFPLLGKIPILTNIFSNWLKPPTSCWKLPWWDNFTWVSPVFWGLEYRCFSNHPRLDTTNDRGWQHHARAVQWLESTDGSSHYPGRRKILMDWVGVFWLLFLLFCWTWSWNQRPVGASFFSEKKTSHTSSTSKTSMGGKSLKN